MALKLLALTAALGLSSVHAACPGLPIPENGITECSKDDTTKQLICSVKCDPGYIFENEVGNIAVQLFACQSNDMWVPSPSYKNCVVDETYVVKSDEKSGSDKKSSTSDVLAELVKPRFPGSPSESSNTCVLWNHRHIKTFDGTQYSFKGEDCIYLITSDCLDDSFELYIKYISETELQLILTWAGKNILLEVTPSGQHIATDLLEKSNIEVPGREIAGLSLESIANYFVIKATNEFSISWDTRTDKIIVILDESLRERTCGLCGNFNMQADDDFQNLEGKNIATATELALSWILPGGKCYQLPEPLDFNGICSKESVTCENLLNNSIFQACHDYVDPQAFYQTCSYDQCQNQCGTLESYLSLCKTHGIMIEDNWRQYSNCPMPKCTGGREWVECGATCENSCEQVNFMNILESECQESLCYEGCRCPAGTYTCPITGSCVPREMCPCTARSQLYKAGDRIQQDCNTCTCASGRFSCTEMDCGATCKLLDQNYVTTFDGKEYNLGQAFSQWIGFDYYY